MVIFVIRKLIVRTRMCSHPVGLDVRLLIGPFVYFYLLAWAFARRLCGKYHNLMSWLKYSFKSMSYKKSYFAAYVI